jgi:hypothetical protein
MTGPEITYNWRVRVLAATPGRVVTDTTAHILGAPANTTLCGQGIFRDQPAAISATRCPECMARTGDPQFDTPMALDAEAWEDA